MQKSADHSKKRGVKKPVIMTSTSRRESGVALVMALIVTLVAFLLVVSALYVITNSTTMSGAGKTYATAAEAADGGIEVMKEAINLVMYGSPINTLPFSSTDASNLVTAAITQTVPPTVAAVTLNLPSEKAFQSYTVKITVERLISKAVPGGRIEFGRSAGGGGSTAVYYRINASATGPNNTKAESSVLYRFVG